MMSIEFLLLVMPKSPSYLLSPYLDGRIPTVGDHSGVLDSLPRINILVHHDLWAYSSPKTPERKRA